MLQGRRYIYVLMTIILLVAYVMPLLDYPLLTANIMQNANAKKMCMYIHLYLVIWPLQSNEIMNPH